jgi:hypothetical protein
MICQKCKKDFPEKEIHEHHIHPRFMENKKGDGRKIYLCEKCHNILHLLIPTIIWGYIPNNKKDICIKEVINFSYGRYVC